MSKTMLAGRLTYADRSFTMTEVDLPEPGAGEVRVRVKAAGVCLSDVHILDGSLPGTPEGVDEVTLGHEIAGVVEALGEGVAQPAVGTRVIVEAMKDDGGAVRTLGVDYDGGWAEYVIADAGAVITIPDDLPFDQAAIIPDAVSTPWAAISSTARVRAGESVAVWGVGGLGAHAIQLLRFVGAVPIIAVDPQPAARDRALALGADLALDPSDPQFSAVISEHTAGGGLDVALDFAGVAPARTQALQVLGTGGRLVLVGISGAELRVDNDLDFQFAGQQILGHYGSEGHHVRELVRFAAAGRLDLSGSVTGRYPLAQAAEAVEALTTKKGNPIRLVLEP